MAEAYPDPGVQNPYQLAFQMYDQLSPLVDSEALTHLWYNPENQKLYHDQTQMVLFRDISEETLKQMSFDTQKLYNFRLTVTQFNLLVGRDRHKLFLGLNEFGKMPSHLADEKNLNLLNAVRYFDTSKAFANPEQFPGHCPYYGSHSFRYASAKDDPKKQQPGLDFDQLDASEFYDCRARIWEVDSIEENKDSLKEDRLVGFYHNADRNQRCPVIAGVKRGVGLMKRSAQQKMPIVKEGKWPVAAIRHPPSLFRFLSEPIEDRLWVVTVEEDCFLLGSGESNGQPWADLLYVLNNGRSQKENTYEFENNDGQFANTAITVYIILGGDNPGTFKRNAETKTIKYGQPWSPDVQFEIKCKTGHFLSFEARAVAGHDVGRYLMSAQARTRRMGTLSEQSQYEGPATPIHYRNVGNRSEDNPPFHYSKMWSLKFPHNRLTNDTEFEVDDLVMKCVGERTCDRLAEERTPNRKTRAELWNTTPFTDYKEQIDKEEISKTQAYHETIETICYSFVFPNMDHAMYDIADEYYSVEGTNGLLMNDAFDLNQTRMHYVFMLTRGQGKWATHELYPNVKMFEVNVCERNNDKKDNFHDWLKISADGISLDGMIKYDPPPSNDIVACFPHFGVREVKFAGGFINNFWRKLWATRMTTTDKSVFMNDVNQQALFEKWQPFTYHEQFMQNYRLNRPIEHFAHDKDKVRVVSLKPLLNDADENASTRLLRGDSHSEEKWLSGLNEEFFRKSLETPPNIEEFGAAIQFTLEAGSTAKCIVFDCSDVTESDLNLKDMNYSYGVNQNSVLRNTAEVADDYIKVVLDITKNMRNGKGEFYDWPGRVRHKEENTKKNCAKCKKMDEQGKTPTKECSNKCVLWKKMDNEAKPPNRCCLNFVTIYIISSINNPEDLVFGALNVPPRYRVYLVNAKRLGKALLPVVDQEYGKPVYLKDKNYKYQTEMIEMLPKDRTKALVTGEVWVNDKDTPVVGVLHPTIDPVPEKTNISKVSWHCPLVKEHPKRTMVVINTVKNTKRNQPIVTVSKIEVSDRVMVTEKMKSGITHHIHYASTPMFDIAKGYPCVGAYFNTGIYWNTTSKKFITMTYKGIEPAKLKKFGGGGGNQGGGGGNRRPTSNRRPRGNQFSSKNQAVGGNQVAGGNQGADGNQGAGVFRDPFYDLKVNASTLVEMALSFVGAGLALAAAAWTF